VGLVLVGCGDDGPGGSGPTSSDAGAQTGCTTAVASIVSATERYVSGYESGRAVSAVSPAEQGSLGASTTTADPGPGTMTEADLQAALADADAVLRDQQCDPLGVRTALTEGLGRVATEGPVADAVLRQITASMTGRLAAQPGVTTVGPGDDLRDALAMSPDGSTLQLEAGEYRLDTSLVLLTGVVLRGAGRDATTITSTAPDAAVLALTDRRVELIDLTVHREGDAPGSAILGGPAASVVVSGARLTGAKVDQDGQGGAGILMYDDGQAAAGRGTTLEVTDTELRDNEAAGIVLSGGHRASVVRTAFLSNGQCGICFLDAADGSVEDSSFEGNGIGVAATGTARPTVLRVIIQGGEVGVQAADAAAPVIDGATISGAIRAAIIYSGDASGSLDKVTCQDVPFGIVVGPGAHPQVGATDCELARSP
jgi:hypothetical protein